MKTKYYVIQFNNGHGWQNLDDIEYTESEIRDALPTDNSTLKFRRKFIKEEETVFLSVSRESLNAFKRNKDVVGISQKDIIS